MKLFKQKVLRAKKYYQTYAILHGISEFPKILKSLVNLVLRLS